METIIAFALLGALVVLDLAAWRWGADSTDGPDSDEWERRRAWRRPTGPAGGA